MLGRLLFSAVLWALSPAAWAAEQPHRGFAPPAGLGGPIDLVDQHGSAFSLSRLAGRPALVFFGFVRCGTTCPIALATAQQILAAFGPAAAPAVVFVTLDPLSDSPKDLGAYLSKFDSRLIGLTGSPDRIERAAERYGVGRRVHANGVDHSSMWYLLDRDGHLRRVYPHTTPASDLVEDVRVLQAQ